MHHTDYKNILAAFNDFKYEQQTSSSGKPELVEEITDRPNLEERAEGNSKWFELDAVGKILKKENIIVTSWKIENLRPNERSIYIDFFTYLINDGYPVYISQEGGLKKIEDVFLVDKELHQLKPINKKNAILMAGTLGLKKKSLRVLNSLLYKKIHNEYLSQKWLLDTFACPLYNQYEIQFMNSYLDDDEMFGIEIKDEKMLFEPEPRIGRLVIKRNLSTEEVQQIVQCYPNVSELCVDHSKLSFEEKKLTFNWFWALLSHYPRLSLLFLNSCMILFPFTPNFDKTPFANLKNIRNLTRLFLQNSVLSASLLGSLLKQNLKLIKLYLYINSYDFCHIIETFQLHFPQLAFLNIMLYDGEKLPSPSLMRKMINHLLNSAPQLNSLNFKIKSPVGMEAFLSQKKPAHLMISRINFECLGISSAPPFSFLSWIELFPNLSSLRLINEEEMNFVEQTIEHTLNSDNPSSLYKLRQLKELGLVFCKINNRQHLSTFLTFFPDLVDLMIIDRQPCFNDLSQETYSPAPVFSNLQSLESNTLESISWIANSASTLAYLSYLTPQREYSYTKTMSRLLQKNPHLQIIRLHYSYDDNAFTELKLPPDHFRRMHRLELLGVNMSQEKNPEVIRVWLQKFCSFVITLANAAPNIAVLNIAKGHFQLFDNMNMPALKYLSSIFLTTTSPLSMILPHFPNLYFLYLMVLNHQSFNNDVVPFPQVKYFYWASPQSPINFDCINQLFPNLHKCGIQSNRVKFTGTPNTIKTLYFEHLNFTIEQLKPFLFPTLNKIVLTLNTLKQITNEEIEQLKLEYPYIYFKTQGQRTTKESIDTSSPEENPPPPETVQLTPPDPNLVLRAKKRFYSKGSQPDPSCREEYVNVFQFVPHLHPQHPWKLYQPNDDELEDAAPTLLPHYNPDAVTGDHYYFGVERFNSIKPHHWHMLPAPATHSVHEKLLTFWSNSHVSFTFKRHKKLGFFYFRFEGNEPIFVNVTYHLYSPPFSISLPPVDPNTVKLLMRFISTLRFDHSGFLSGNQIGYSTLLACEKTILVKALSEFCSFSNANPPITKTMQGKLFEVFNFLIEHKPGLLACEFRAKLYTALNLSLAISAFMITNDLHAFAINDNGQNNFIRIDLGGTISRNEIDHNPVLNDIEQHIKRIKMIKPSAAISPDNRFQTQKRDSVQSLNSSTFFRTIFSNDRKRQLIILNNESCIEMLHEVLCNSKIDLSRCFFTPELDELSLTTRKTLHGKIQHTDSPLALFLKKSTQKLHYWFIDWSHPKQEHAGFKSILDNNHPHLNGLSIPEHVHIIVLMDRETKDIIGSAFQDTMNEVIDAHFIPELPPIQFEKHPMKEGDVVVYIEEEWQYILLGHVEYNNGELELVYGKLPNATSAFTIHNPPIENKSFRFFMREYRARGSFWFKGMYFDTGKLAVQYSRIKLKPMICELPASNHQLNFILNLKTFPNFFEKHILTETGLQKVPGLLQRHSHQSILFTVTEMLSIGRWLKLLNEQKKYFNHFQFQTTLNVSLPSVLTTVELPKKLISSVPKRIGVIVTNDVDWALDELQHQSNQEFEEIPIGPADGFYSQFLSIEKDKNGNDIAVKTKLNQLVREGKSILFFGECSFAFSKKMETLFSTHPYLVIGEETVSVTGKIFFVTQRIDLFSEIQCEEMNYNFNVDLNKLPDDIQNTLRSVYEKLKITPARGHFRDCPFHQKHLVPAWSQGLIQRLHLSKGIDLSSTNVPTDPVSLLNSLKHKPFYYFTSETGDGKSYFMEHEVPLHCPVYHEKKNMNAWLNDQHSALTIDEINTENDHQWIFSNCARGQRLIWKNGNQYLLTEQVLMFAGNKNQYGNNRNEPDLVRRYPHYIKFIPKPVHALIQPVLQLFQHPEPLILLVEHYYHQAKAQHLPFSRRNAINICMSAFALRKRPELLLFSNESILLYAILNELNTLMFDREMTKNLRKDLKSREIWVNSGAQLKQTLKNMLHEKIKSHSAHAWIPRDEKIALTLMIMLFVREERIHAVFQQNQGISSLLLEGTKEQGIDALVKSLYELFNLNPFMISLTSPDETQKQLLHHFHKGHEISISEYNSNCDEKQFNCYLSGVDHFKKPPQKNGFFSIATQEPIVHLDSEALSKAQENRSLTIRIKDFTEADLLFQLTNKYQLDVDAAKQLLAEFMEAKTYAKENENSFFTSTPKVEHLFKEAEKISVQAQSISSRYSETGKRAYPF